MALAFLCKKLQEENLEFGKYLRDGSFTSLSYLRAFIVDHGAREGSAKEARQVADWLMKIGIEFVWLIASTFFSLFFFFFFFDNYPLGEHSVIDKGKKNAMQVSSQSSYNSSGQNQIVWTPLQHLHLKPRPGASDSSRWGWLVPVTRLTHSSWVTTKMTILSRPSYDYAVILKVPAAWVGFKLLQGFLSVMAFLAFRGVDRLEL